MKKLIFLIVFGFALAGCVPYAKKLDTIHAGMEFRAYLFTGVDAPIGSDSPQHPEPLLFKLADSTWLPDGAQCSVIGDGYGDLGSERLIARVRSMTCHLVDGHSITVPVKGYVVGEDRKAGIKGNLLSKQKNVALPVIEIAAGRTVSFVVTEDINFPPMN